MDKPESMPATTGQARNPLSYTLIALGILLLVMGLPVFFATSQITRLIGDSVGQVSVLITVGLLIVVAGATSLAVGLRKR